MLLVVNIGNSNIRFGVFKEEECLDTWVINSKPFRMEDEYYSDLKVIYQNYNIALDSIKGIAISSVVPRLTYPIKKALFRLHGVRSVMIGRESPSEIKEASPQMGADLYANAVAAHQYYKGKKIVVDFGTALTLTTIDENATVLGVVIAPGVITSLHSLIGATAQLPDIELKMPPKVLGKTTIHCMQSGIIYGFLSMVEGLVDRINAEIQDKATVITTGGMGHAFINLTERLVYFDRLHTLKGIRLLYLNELKKEKENTTF